MRSRKDNIKIKFKKGNTLSIIMTAAVVVVILICGIKLGVESVYATKGDQILDMTAQRDRIVETNKQLETEIAEEQSLDRVQQEATQRLGMVKAKPVTYIDITSAASNQR